MGTVLPNGTVEGQFAQVLSGNWNHSTYSLPITLGGGEVGEVLTVYGEDIATFETPIDKGLFYRIASQGISDTQLFLQQWTTGAIAKTTIGAAGYANALITGTLKWFRLYHSTPTVVDEPITYTVIINGTDSAVSLVLSAALAGPVDDLTSTIAVNAGDLISVRADGANASRGVKCALEFFLV
jgi:hypothetical protein